MRVRLKEWRERRLLTQRELATRVGVTQGTIARIERGHHRPRLSTVRRLAEALGVSAEQLVDWGEDTPDVDTDDGVRARTEDHGSEPRP